MVDCGVGLGSPSKDDFSIYPNPCFGQFNLTNNQSSELICEIYSATGKLIKTFAAQPGENRIEINTLTSGIYLIKTNKSDHSHYQKIIVK